MNFKEFIERLPFYERRKRVKRPVSLNVFGLLFLIVLPIYNYLGLAWRHGFEPAQPLLVFQHLNLVELVLLFLPILVGIGMLMVRNWGWWLFLIFSAGIISYDLYVFFSWPVVANAGALIQALLLAGAMFYFLRRDIAAPYMKMYPRGWRFQKRRPISVPVLVNGLRMITRDISPGGLYIKWPDVDLAPGSPVALEFKLGETNFKIAGGIASVTPGHGAGIAFREPTSEVLRELEQAIDSVETGKGSLLRTLRQGLLGSLLFLFIGSCAGSSSSAVDPLMMIGMIGTVGEPNQSEDVSYDFEQTNTSATTGRYYSFSLSVSGNSTAARIENVYLSENRTISRSDYFLGAISVPGRTSTQSFRLYVSCGIPAGTYYIGILGRSLRAATVTIVSGCAGSTSNFLSFSFAGVPSNAARGKSMSFSLTTSVTGSPSARTCTVRFSSDTFISSFDTSGGSITIQPTAGTQNFTITTPASLTVGGTYYIGFYGGDCYSSSPRSSTKVTIQEGDLLSYSIASHDAQAANGTTLNFSLSVSVSGSPSALNCDVHLLRYSFSAPEAANRVGNITINAATGTPGYQVTVPAGLSGGTYYIRLAGSGCFARSNTKVTVSAGFLNFTIASIDASAALGGGLGVALNVTATGSPSTRFCSAMLSLDNNATGGVNAAFLGTVQVQNTTGVQNTTVNIPGTLAAGSYYLKLTGSAPCGKVSPTTVSISQGAAVAVNVTGTARYEHIPINTSTFRLDTAGKSNRPARYVGVELLDYDGTTIIATGTTDGSGNYALSGTVNGAFKVRMVARMVKTTAPTYDFKIVDAVPGTSVGAVHSAVSSSVTAGAGGNIGLDLTAVDSTRKNGAFSILDVIRTSMDKILAVDANTVFPPLNVKWRINGTDGSYFTTEESVCGTGVSRCVVLLGSRTSDSDDFDLHVVAHEFTHYLENALSRSDSRGGGHATNDLLDPRLAYGEGLGNAMSGLFLDDPQYSDTTSSGGFGFNLESGSHTLKGFYSEASVQSVIWDLFDTNNETGDNLSLGFAPVWNAVLALKDIDGITSLHEFIKALKNARPGDVTDIDSILALENVAPDFASETDVSSSVSAPYAGYISTHTCNGSGAAFPYNPVFQLVTGTGTDAYPETAHTGSQWCGAVAPGINKLFGSQFFRIIPQNSGTMTITKTDSNTSDWERSYVYVFRRGVRVGYASQYLSPATVNVVVTANTEYILEIHTRAECYFNNYSTCGTGGGLNHYTVKIDLP